MVLFGLSAAVVSLHLLFLKRGLRVPCVITKAFLVPSLLLLFVELSAAGNILFENIFLLYSGMLLYTLGDILLEIKVHPVFFYIGASSFAVGHIMNAAFFLSQGFTLTGLLLAALLCIALLCTVLWFLEKQGSEELFISAVYLSFVMVMGIGIGGSALPMPTKLISLLGALIFCFSDSLILLSRIQGNTKRYDIGIMSTYIGANALILAGLLFS